MSETAIAAVAAAVGLIAGSFINVVAYRIPLGRSVVTPGSACPRCEQPIAWHDNIPVLSWIFLRGKCRKCGARISVRYPLVEVVTAVAFYLVAASIGQEWVLPAYLWFAGVGVTLTITDIDHKLIPNAILFPSTAIGAGLLGLGALLDGEPIQFVWALVGGAAYFGALLVLALVARGGFGFGDVKLAAFLGMFSAYLGWGRLAIAAILPFFLGGAISILLLVTRIKGRKDAIPFGPYMVLAAFLAVVAGDAIIDWYLN